jgi:hypothetical protein
MIKMASIMAYQSVEKSSSDELIGLAHLTQRAILILTK